MTLLTSVGALERVSVRLGCRAGATLAAAATAFDDDEDWDSAFSSPGNGVLLFALSAFVC